MSGATRAVVLRRFAEIDQAASVRRRGITDAFGRCANSVCGMVFDFCLEQAEPCCSSCDHPPEPLVTADHTPERLSADEWERIWLAHDTPRTLRGTIEWLLADRLAAHLADVEARLAAAWDEGEAAGLNNAQMAVDGEFIENPYRAALHPDPSEVARGE
jgi:hypothetical protein